MAVVRSNRTCLSSGQLGGQGGQGKLGDRRPGARSTPPFAFIEADGVVQRTRLTKLAINAAHPVIALVGTKPVLGRAAQHEAAKVTTPAVAVVLASGKRVLSEVGG